MPRKPKHWVDVVLDAGLTLRDCKLLTHLAGSNNACYLADVADATGLGRAYLARALESNTDIYKRVELPSRPNPDGTRPHTLGMMLTAKGKKIAERLPS